MTPIEKKKLEAFAARLLKDYPVTVAKLTDLSKAGYDLALLRDIVSRYGKLPAAERQFVLRMSGENLVVTPMSAASPEDRAPRQSPKPR